VPEAVLACDVAVAVFEDEDGSFVDFDCTMDRLRGGGGGGGGGGGQGGVREGVVDICFFACREDAVERVQDGAVDELEEDHPRAGVEDLFGGGTVGFIV